MNSPEPTGKDRRLLSALIDTLPKGVPPDQHQEDIASILEFFERLHEEHGAAFPDWLVLGRQLYLSNPELEQEPT
ncbi:MAG TPA: hypothetical protein VFE05_17580 [Longimicrobiaceae bacterium]|jgi:hypothetical protein|nr:hypothetical protein [Longimicrobiaceae bacterium]